MTAEASPQIASSPTAPFRILSLDGGGAKGFYTIGILEEVEKLMGRPLCECFDLIFADMTFNVLKWLYHTTDRTKFVCANEQYYLLRDESLVCWPIANGEKFIKAAIELWDKW